MKKRYFLITLLIIILTFAVALVAACDKKPNGGETPETPGDSAVLDGSNEEYNEQLYTYSFNSNGGSSVDGGSLYKNEYIPAPQKPVRAGYAFTGWYYDEECTRLCEFIDVRMPGRNLTFYAGWRQLYTITFETNDGSAIAPLEGDAGVALTAEQVASIVTTRADYVFEGWYLEKELKNRVVLTTSTTFPSEDVTVYAKWRPLNKSVTVTIIDTKGDDNPDNDTTTVKEGLVEGSKLELTEGTFADETYGKYLEFTCWALNANGGKPVSMNYTVPSADVTLYSIYHQKSDWAYVTIEPSPYLTGEYKDSGISFYIKKGVALGNISEGDISLSMGSAELVAYLRDNAALAAQNLTANYLITASGTRYSPSSVIADNITLKLEVISSGLTYDGVYTYNLDPNGFYGYFYGLADIAAFLKKEESEVDSTDLDFFTKRYYFVKSYNPTGATDIYVPSTYWQTGDEYRYWMIGVGEGVFQGNTTITSVNLPDSIQWIESYAFDGCTALKTVNLPAKLTEIGDSAFRNTAVEEFVIPENLSYMGYKVFENTPFETDLYEAANGGAVYLNKGRMIYGYAGNLSGSITVSKPDVMVICGGAFAGQNNIVTLTISDSVVYLCKGAFKDCKNLVSVTLGANLYYIFDEAFDGCEKLGDLTMRNRHTLTMVGAHAFRDTAITYFYFGMNFVTLGEGAFENCAKLTNAEMYVEKFFVNGTTYYLSTLINYIPKDAFKNCVSLTSFQAMDEVLEIASSAFEGCTSLQEVTLGDTANAYIYAVREDAFKGCTNLHRIIVKKPATSVENCINFEDGCFDANLDKFYIQVPGGSYDNYLRAMSAAEATDETEAKTESMYINRIVTSGSGAPRITIKNSEVAIGQSYSFTIDADFVKQYATAEDTTYNGLELTPAEDLVWTIVSVTYDDKTVTPNQDGTYDLLELGVYTITFRVSDGYGTSTVARINIVVQSNVI